MQYPQKKEAWWELKLLVAAEPSVKMNNIKLHLDTGDTVCVRGIFAYVFA